MATPLLDRETILQAIQLWPREQQLALAREIALGVADDERPAAPRRGSWRDLIGILATDQPPPTDDEIKRWHEERRMEKYGG